MRERLRALTQSWHRARPQSRAARRARALRELQALPEQPTISLVMPTYRTELRYLRQAIKSVQAQHYPAWELCIVDDGSERPEIGRAVEAYAATDPRIHLRQLEHNQGISAASNEGLAMVSGEFVGFLDHDDELVPEALLRVAQEISAHPGTDVVYTDSDKLTPHGRRADPFLKPDWSPVYALGAMYIGHLLVVRRSLAEEAGGFDSAYDSIQDFEFMLRVSERTDRIRHIPQILYHWRAIPGSIAAGAEEKSGISELQARAVSAHLERLEVPAAATPHATIPHRAVLVPRGKVPRAKVSAIVADRRGGSGRLLDSLFERAGDGGELEAIVVRGPWSPQRPATGEHPFATVEDDGNSFGRARVQNLGAAVASGRYLLFLADTVEVATDDWLAHLLVHAQLPNVGAVGPQLVRPDGRTDRAGMAIALAEPAGPMMSGFDADGDGYYGSMPCAREVSGVDAACMLVRRDAFEAVGGFNEFYERQYEDLDLCQRLASAGFSSVYAPRPRFVDREIPAERRANADIVDRALFVDCWYDRLLAGDPYFNPGFGRERADYVPAESWHRRAAGFGAALGEQPR